MEITRGEKFGGAGLGVELPGELGMFGVGGKLLRQIVFSLEVPLAFISILYGLLFLLFFFALLKGNFSVSTLTDLETTGGTTGQHLCLQIGAFVPLSVDVH